MNKRIELLKTLISEDEAVFISSYPNIFYYSGFTSEDAFLFITTEQCYIITDSRYTIQARQQAPDFELFDISTGIDKLISHTDKKNIYYEEKHLTVDSYMRLKRRCKDKRLTPMSDNISAFRSIKDNEEIEKIRCAEELGDAAFSHILDFLRPGVSETDIALEIEFFMRKNGASKLSFDTIAASGVRSAMPHGTASSKTIRQGELLTLDFGCVLDGYCSDMTRTVAIGEPEQILKEIYEITLLAQQTALENMRVGMKCADIDSLARDVISASGYGDNFGHSLGHSVGIEIHETPVFSPKSLDLLKDGNVITVEPGIYIENVGGVRIEDVIAVSGNKIINLTKSTKELIII